MWDTKGDLAQPIRTFSLAQPPWVLERAAAGHWCQQLEIHALAIANGRVYARDHDTLRVCDLDGQLMQSAQLAADSHGDCTGLTSLVGAEHARKVNVRGCHGLLVDAHRLLFFAHAARHPGFLGAPWHDGPSVLGLISVAIAQ